MWSLAAGDVIFKRKTQQLLVSCSDISVFEAIRRCLLGVTSGPISCAWSYYSHYVELQLYKCVYECVYVGTCTPKLHLNIFSFFCFWFPCIRLHVDYGFFMRCSHSLVPTPEIIRGKSLSVLTCSFVRTHNRSEILCLTKSVAAFLNVPPAVCLNKHPSANCKLFMYLLFWVHS